MATPEERAAFRERWRRYLLAHGVRVVMVELDVGRSTVYGWLSGKRLPMPPETGGAGSENHAKAVRALDSWEAERATAREEADRRARAQSEAAEAASLRAQQAAARVRRDGAARC